MGWRMDEMTASGPVGLEMLANPFAIVPKEQNAERIELAFRLLGSMKNLMEGKDKTTWGAWMADWFGDHKDEVAKVVGAE
jgi:hypothetical protein